MERRERRLEPAIALCLAAIASAPPASAAEPTSTATAGVSSDDLESIEAALGEDREQGAGDREQTAVTVPQAGLVAAVQGYLPDIALIGDFAFAHFDGAPNLQTGGHDPTANGFNFQQLELAIGAAVDPYFRFDSNIVFSPFGVEVEEAYGTTLGLGLGLQVRAGQMLTRFGRINPTHPHRWDFADQPFALGRVFGGEGNRGAGAEVSWLLPLPWYVEALVSATMASGESTARSFFGGRDLGVRDPRDLEWVAALKQFFPFGEEWSLLFGLSGATGPNPTGRSNRTEVAGADVFLKYRPVLTPGDPTVVSLQVEWLHRRYQIPGAVLTDHGGYAQLSWRFAERWDTAARFELGTPSLDGDGVSGRDPLDPEWDETRWRASASLTHRPTEFSRIRAQGSVDRPLWLDQPIYAAFVAVELSIGAHGAHEY